MQYGANSLRIKLSESVAKNKAPRWILGFELSKKISFEFIISDTEGFV